MYSVFSFDLALDLAQTLDKNNDKEKYDKYRHWLNGL